MKLTSFLLCGLMTLFAFGTADARVWTNTQGKKVTAHYLTSDETDVIIVLTKDGKEVKIPKNMFSPEDVKYIEEQEVLLTVPAYEVEKKANEQKASESGRWQRSI